MNNYKVYKHTTPSNKVYIGLTGNSVIKRWNNGNNYRNNKYFYRAIKKYGWKNIKHEILEENLSYEEACKKEIYYIKLYNSIDSNDGYNNMIGGIPQDEEIRKLMSKNNKNRKRILCLKKIHKENDYIYEMDIFSSVKECSEYTHFSIGTIENRLKNSKIKEVYYYLIYKTSYSDLYGIMYFNPRDLYDLTILRYSDELLYYLLNIWEDSSKIRIIKKYDKDIKFQTEEEWCDSMIQMCIRHYENSNYNMSH